MTDSAQGVRVVAQSDVAADDKVAVTRFHAGQVKRIMAGDRTLGDNRDAIEQAFAERRLTGFDAGYAAALASVAQPGVVEPEAWLVEWKRDGQDWVEAFANEVSAIDRAKRWSGTYTPVYRSSPAQIEADAFERAAKTCDRRVAEIQALYSDELGMTNIRVACQMEAEQRAAAIRAEARVPASGGAGDTGAWEGPPYEYGVTWGPEGGQDESA